LEIGAYSRNGKDIINGGFGLSSSINISIREAIDGIQKAIPEAVISQTASLAAFQGERALAYPKKRYHGANL